MRFAVVTDVHFGPPARYDGKLRKLTHLAPTLLGTVATELSVSHRPELVVNLGDVVEDSSREVDEGHYRDFLAALAGAQAPALHVAGNHDRVHLEDTALAALWSRPGPLHYSRDVGGVHFAVLCTRYRPLVDVSLPEDQIEWLAADLEQTRLPTVVLVHHPLGEMNVVGNRWFEREPQLCLVANRVPIRQVIARSGKVIAVLNGHAHWGHVAVHDAIPYVTLQSLTENLDEDAPGRPARAFAVCEAGPTGFFWRAFGQEPLRLDWPR